MESHQSSAERGVDETSNPSLDDDMSNMDKEGEGDSVKAECLKPDPLKMRKVLEKIFSFLDVDSIKNARQVNNLWSAEGAKMLITKCFVKIPSDLKVQSLSSESKEMEEFIVFLSHMLSETWMIPNIKIEAASDVDFWKSLGVLGPNRLESLKFRPIGSETELVIDLLNFLPGINYYLSLKGINKAAMDIQSELMMRVLTSVMSGAEKQRLLISSMTLKPETPEELEEIAKFADCKNIMIEELDVMIPDFFSKSPVLKLQVISIIKKLLFSSKNILKKLTLRNCHLFLAFLSFPCMTKLTEIKLKFWPKTANQLSDCTFSQSFRFFEKIPKLRDVTIKFERNTLSNFRVQDFFVNLFQNTGPALSVRNLKYSDYHSDLSIEYLLQIFPNIEYFKSSEYTLCSPAILRSIWKYGKNLRSLEFSFFIKSDDNPDLDSIFTGFTSDTVNEIKKTLGPILDPTALENWRVYPSIVNLKELKQLSMSLRGPGELKLARKTLTVATEFGFKMLSKDLEVFIHVYTWSWESKEPMIALHALSKFSNVTVEFIEHGTDTSEESD